MPDHYVFAAHSTAGTAVCQDAWLLPGEVGEGGYDVGINFSSVDDLVDRLRERRISAGQVRRLALQAHGSSGAVWLTREPPEVLRDSAHATTPDGPSAYFTPEWGWTVRNLDDPQIQRQVRLVGHYLTSRSEVQFLGCAAAANREGTDFLIAMSLRWPGVKVVAFNVILRATGGQRARSTANRRVGEGPCYPPGVAVTAASGASGPRRIDSPEPVGYHIDAAVESSHPWANSAHPLAIVAQNGRIIHWPTGALAP